MNLNYINKIFILLLTVLILVLNWIIIGYLLYGTYDIIANEYRPAEALVTFLISLVYFVPNVFFVVGLFSKSYWMLLPLIYFLRFIGHLGFWSGVIFSYLVASEWIELTKDDTLSPNDIKALSNANLLIVCHFTAGYILQEFKNMRKKEIEDNLKNLENVAAINQLCGSF